MALQLPLEWSPLSCVQLCCSTPWGCKGWSWHFKVSDDHRQSSFPDCLQSGLASCAKPLCRFVSLMIWHMKQNQTICKGPISKANVDLKKRSNLRWFSLDSAHNGGLHRTRAKASAQGSPPFLACTSTFGQVVEAMEHKTSAKCFGKAERCRVCQPVTHPWASWTD